MTGASDDEFVPLALHPGWVLERCHGWSVLEARAPGAIEGAFKLLARRRGPIRTCLLLAHGAPEAEVDALVRRHGLVGALSISVVADLSAQPRASREFAGRAFESVAHVRCLQKCCPS